MLLTELIDVPGVRDVAPLRILVVDSTCGVGELIKHILIRVEHSVDVVGSTSEALDLLQHATYDVVIAEQYLGCRNAPGSDLARRVRLAPCEPAFILATDSLASVTDLTYVDALLLKPFRATTLRRMVARIATRDRR
jgi:CheY-like chemotaxis protein